MICLARCYAPAIVLVVYALATAAGIYDVLPEQVVRIGWALCEAAALSLYIHDARKRWKSDEPGLTTLEWDAIARDRRQRGERRRWGRMP